MSILSKIFCFLIFMGMAMSKGTIFKTHTFTLKNGLQVVAIPNHVSPTVSVAVIYKVGTADDPSDIVGMSHFLEHMMFKGTKKVQGELFKKIILEHGGETNAWTYYDQTVYETDIDANYLELMLELEADRMVNLAFQKKEVESEKEVVMQERLMRLENNPFGLCMEAYLKALYWYHPYGVPPIGYPHHIKNYNYENTLAHYKKWYKPNNAILVVAGAVDLDELKKLVEKHFANLEAGNLPERIRPQEPDHKEITQHIEQENPRNATIHLNWFFAAPSYKSLEKKQLYFALQVLTESMSGNKTRPFYRKIVEDMKVAVDFTARYDDFSLDPMDFKISISLVNKNNVSLAKKLLQEYIDDLLKNGISDEELNKAKRDLIAHLEFATDGNHSSIQHFYSMSLGFSIDDINSWDEKIRSVTKQDVIDAIKIIFSKKPIVTMDLYPKQEKEKQKL